MTSAPVGVGLGFRFPHANAILDSLPDIPWFEVIADDLLYSEPRTQLVARLRSEYPVAFHAIGLNIAGADELDIEYIGQLGTLIEQFDAAWLSDHLCWSASEKRQHFDLLPFPFNEKQLDYISSRVQCVQDHIKRPMMFENISYYTRFKSDEMDEWEFHAELSRRTGCSLLLDLNNLWSNALNFDRDPQQELQSAISQMPERSIQQLHLAGSTRQEDELPYWIDAHAEKVPDPVVDLLCHFCQHHGPVPSIIERDNAIPSFAVLQQERHYLTQRIENAMQFEMSDASGTESENRNDATSASSK